jgi:hypothetical protein
VSLLRPTRTARMVPDPPPAEVDLPADPVEQAEIRRQLDALKERVDAARRPDPPMVEQGSELPRTLGGGPAPSVAELVAAEVARLLATQERERVDRERRVALAAAAAERAERERLARGGPCQYCGITESWARDPTGGPNYGRWHGDVCNWCQATRTRFAARPGSGEAHRDHVVRDLLPVEVTKGKFMPDDLLKRSGFRWWSETPGAPTSARKRFAYVDMGELVGRLEVKPVQYETREPCPRCGCPDMWFLALGYTAFKDALLPHEVWTCTGCRGWIDLAQLVERRIQLRRSAFEGLGPVAGKVLGVAWWAESPEGGLADPPRPCGVPFGYIDWSAVRHRAVEIFPGERSWGCTAAWEQARAA